MSNQSAIDRIERIEGAAQDAARFEVGGDLVLVLGVLQGHAQVDARNDDAARLILYLSPEWEHVFESPVAPLLGRPFSEVVNASAVSIVSRDSCAATVNSTSDIAVGRSLWLQYRDPRQPEDTHGSRVLEGSLYRVLDDPDDCLIIFRDATDNWNALASLSTDSSANHSGTTILETKQEQKFVQSQRLESLGALAGGVAHDFNNFLTPIVGNVSLALLDLPASSPVRKRVEMIRTAADRAAALTRQMLTYASQGEPHVNAVSLTTEIEELTLLLEASSAGSTKIDYVLKPGLPFLELDSQHVGQIVLNLVANACESFPETGGQIEINTGSIDADPAYLELCLVGDDLEAGQYVYLEVCDNGAGIPHEIRNQIFEPYFTMRASQRGIGLTAIAEIVRGYRGAIDLRSKLGEGTRVRILFPAFR